MNAARLLSDLAGQGFALSIEHGRLIVSPSSRLSENARAEIRTHKSELLSLLAANDQEHLSSESDPIASSVVSQENKDRPYRLFLVTRPTGEQFSLSRNPPATLIEIQADYPGCTVEVEPDPPPTAALADDDKALAQALLDHWDEDDPVTVADYLDGLARSPERLERAMNEALRLGLAVEVADSPRPSPASDAPPSKASPPTAALADDDKALALALLDHWQEDDPDIRKPGSCWPWPDAEIRCNKYSTQSNRRSTTR